MAGSIGKARKSLPVAPHRTSTRANKTPLQYRGTRKSVIESQGRPIMRPRARRMPLPQAFLIFVVLACAAPADAAPIQKSATPVQSQQRKLIQQTNPSTAASAKSALQNKISGQQGAAGKGQIQRTNNALKGKLDTMSDVSMEKQQRLQMYQDAHSKTSSTLSNIVKRNSQTSGSVIKNMK